MASLRQRIGSLLGVETRAQGYTAIIQQAVGRAMRDPGSDAASTAAVEFGLGLLSRAFAVATVSPDLPALGAQYRSGLILDLLSRGNHVALITVQGGGIRLHRASHYDVQGGYDPETWRYHLSLPGPTTSASIDAPAAQVVHVRYGATADQPWRGESPLAAAGISADLLARVETSLRREFAALSVQLVTHPGAYLPNQAARREFAQSLSDSERQVLVDAGNEGWRSRGSSGGSWQQVRLGPEPTAHEVELRSQVAQDVLSAMGIPAGLYQPREGAVSRESYRQLLTACVQPYAALAEEELAAKLAQPVRLGFHRLAAADVAARARAYGSLVQAGVAPDSAAMIAGIDDAAMAPPQPAALSHGETSSQ